jgi:hypothetical protein
MATPKKRWPNSALEALENTQAILAAIDKLAKEAQTASAEGDRMKAVIIGSDIRAKAQKASLILSQAYLGTYETEE